MKTIKPNTRRRNFLLAAGLGGAGAVAVVAGAHKAQEPGAQVAGSAPDAEGYRETDHILKYYKTTEV
jgi:hypothetical protein